jgi:hypothetical protein
MRKIAATDDTPVTQHRCGYLVHIAAGFHCHGLAVDRSENSSIAPL